MFRAAVTLLKVLSILAVIAGAFQGTAAAQDVQPPPHISPYLIEKQDYRSDLDDPHPGRQGKGYIPAWAASSQGEPVLSPLATGGPDSFGYTWNDSVPFNWIDATGGVNTGLQGNNEYTSAIDIGFDFKFYENTYSQLYIGTDGLITFTEVSGYSSNRGIPSPASPNNFIAPFWDQLGVNYEGLNTGAVYTMSGGTAPNRYFVVEWFEISHIWDENRLTFEVVLYENGDILVQYLSLSGYLDECTVGIEDGDGLDGVQYIYNHPGLESNKAVRFIRPGPSARIKMWPLHQGRFTHAGETVDFQMPIHNIGEQGSDIFDLFVSSPWPVSLYAADGATLLTDTDADGAVDTGSISQGGKTTVTVKVSTPDGVAVGDDNIAKITASSSLDTGKSKTASLRAAIPAPFAQAYSSQESGGMALYLVQPTAQALKKVTPNWYYSYGMAVTETPGGFAYFWSKNRFLNDVMVEEIEFTLLDHYGQTQRGVNKLTDHSDATVYTYDADLVAAAAPDGRIGVIWLRSMYDWSNGTHNNNIYYAILDPSGNLVVPPENLTHNTLWGDWDDLNIPSFSEVRIDATDDNRFVIAWLQEHYASPGGECTNYCAVSDIYYSIRGTDGGVVKPATAFTADTPGWDNGYYSLNLARLSGNRMLFVWYGADDNLISYGVLDSAGNTVKAKTSTGSGGWAPDAVQLSNGNIVIAWSAWENRFVVLDSAYSIIAGPNTLINPAASNGEANVSVTADSSGHAILTWTDNDWSTRNLYYALVNSNGDVLTPPMIFQTVQEADAYLYTNLEGYGNTSYSWTPPAAVDGVVGFSTSVTGGQPGSTTALGVQVANHGAAPAAGVVLTATLASELTYIGDTSGVTPTVSGNQVVWHLPDLGFLDVQKFSLIVRLPADAAYGTRYEVTLNLASDGPEANAADNTGSMEVMAARQVFLPLTTRGR